MVRYVENLQYAAERYHESLQEAEKTLAEAQRARDAWLDRLAKINALLEYERERNGAQIRLDQDSPYRGLSTREAASEVIRRGGVKGTSIGEIIEVLKSNGYAFDTKYPGRAVHAALIGASGVEKVNGRYQWRNGQNGAN